MNDVDRREESATRSLTLEREIAATPEEVWVALSTADGLRRWFPLDARVTPGASGSIWLSWGPGCEGEAPIHIWEPNTRFGWTESYGDDEAGRPIEVAVDFTLEGRAGATIVRLVQSGLGASSEWDEMYDALKDGWTHFLFNLAFYFLEHRGQVRRLVWRRAETDLARDALWQRLAAAALIGPTGGGTTGSGADGGGATGSVGQDEDVVELLLDRPRPAHVVSQREGFHFAATLTDLDNSVLFVELEGRHVGIWLSTYGMDADRVSELQNVLDKRVEALLE